MGSKPVLDAPFNKLFVAYEQCLVHDITLDTSVTDPGRTPILPCGFNSQDTDMCTVIDITAHDLLTAKQKRMAMAATTEASTDQTCSLGLVLNNQMNEN